MLRELSFENCRQSKDPLISCALEGVASVIAGLKDVAVVVHSPQGCAATVAAAYDAHEIDFTRRKIACSRLFEMDIVMGATDKLKDLILQADSSFKAKVLFVVGTCAADIIGEDLGAVCRGLQGQVSARLVPVMAGGFRGDAYAGMEIGLQALLPLVNATGEKGAGPKVNLIAPQANFNPTWWADLKWVGDTLGRLGVGVQATIARDLSLAELANAPDADASILLSHDVGGAFAEELERRGCPLILDGLPLPVGTENTARWLRALGELFDATDEAERIIEEGEKRVQETLRRRGLMIIPRYRNCRVAVSADATLGIPLMRMLFQELEMIPELLLLRGDSPRGRALLEKETSDLGINPKVVFGADGWKVKQALKESRVEAVFGSNWERTLAEELGIKIAFDVFHPSRREHYLDRPYFGYEGMLHFLETVANDWETSLRSKQIAWEQVR
jgi:nitrogenase molybdenum-iron protein alpha/beta subunit